MSYRFGEFALDPASRRLSRGGATLHISPKAFALLRLLLEERPRAVPKAELFSRLWPDTYVSEVNLPTLIAEIRRALNDRARAPQIVRTVHGYGYAFCAAAHDFEDPPAETREPSAICWVIGEKSQAALTQGFNLVGRGRDVTVWIDDVSVSRHHARITVQGQVATLEDLNSKNGTYLRGQRITSAVRLVHGDQFAVGPVVLTFHVGLEDESTRTQLASSETALPAHDPSCPDTGGARGLRERTPADARAGQS